MTPNIRCKGGTAVITGAAAGVGGGLARKAASMGMNLVLADLDAGPLDQVARTVDTEVTTVPTDVTDPTALENLAEQAWRRFGRVDLLFNNAGVLRAGLSWEISPEHFQRCLMVNVMGIHHGLRAFVSRLLREGTPAHIVNTASLGGFLCSPMLAPYNASKAAVVSMTESLYGELKMLGAPIGVSVLDPGPVRSGIFAAPFGQGGGNTAESPDRTSRNLSPAFCILGAVECRIGARGAVGHEVVCTQSGSQGTAPSGRVGTVRPVE